MVRGREFFREYFALFLSDRSVIIAGYLYQSHSTTL